MGFITDQTTQAVITQVAELVASLGVLAAVWLLNKYTGIKIAQVNVDRLKSAAATEAGVLVANAEDNLRNKQMTPDSPSVMKAAANIEQRNPDAVEKTGVTPETLQHFVVGEIGKLQAQQIPQPTEKK